ncbi:MAG: linear amide C-N hydrolase [Cyanobacteria bacterium P01_G01_bin.54]
MHTSVSVKVKDGSLIVGRALEFNASETHNFLSFIPSNFHYNAVRLVIKDNSPDLLEAIPTNIKWIPQYAYCSIDISNNIPRSPTNTCWLQDGMNEKRLAINEQYLLGYTELKNNPPNPNSTLTIFDLISYLLGTFATVQEAKQAIQKLRTDGWSVTGLVIPGMGDQNPFHLRVDDPLGDSGVIEFVKANPDDNTMPTSIPSGTIIRLEW